MPAVNTSVSMPPITATRRRHAWPRSGRRPRPRAPPTRRRPHGRRAASPCRPSRRTGRAARSRGRAGGRRCRGRARRRRGRRARNRWSTTPGSRSPLRVAITIPPVGVRPMVVSTEAPSTTAHRLAPAAEVRHHGPTQLPGTDAADDVLVGEAVEAVAAHARAPRPRGAGRSGPPRAASSGGTRCRSTPRARHVGERRARASMPARQPGWCSGARDVSACSSARSASSTAAATSCRLPPCTTRWPTAVGQAGGPGRAARRRPAAARRRRPGTAVPDQRHCSSGPSPGPPEQGELQRRGADVDAQHVVGGHRVNPARSSRGSRACPRGARGRRLWCSASLSVAVAGQLGRRRRAAGGTGAAPPHRW